MEPVSGDTVGGNPVPTKKLKRGKLRSAWITFAGRVVAQVVGSVATIALGILLVQRSQRSAEPVAEVAKPAVASRVRSNPAQKSIAVLPLANYSGDASVNDFADGMTEAIIAGLTRIDTLRVISRTSVMRYKKDDRKPLWEIARELDVDLVIEGSIVRTGSRIRLTVQLIDAGTDEHRWAQSYERTVRDVLGVQSELARSIATDVELALGGSSALALAPQERGDVER